MDHNLRDPAENDAPIELLPPAESIAPDVLDRIIAAFLAAREPEGA